MDDLIGREIGGYLIQRKLGRGGMATVYLAKEIALGRDVALKIMASGLSSADDQVLIKRFRREAQAAAALDHPNIVQIYHTGEDKGLFYIAMEYASGGNLLQAVRTSGPFSPERALRTARDVADVLAAAHAKQIIHRDIKPANILLDARGRVKVTDFGIASLEGQLTKLTGAGHLIGTPEFLAPELCQGKPADPRTDIYALGITVYHLLTGRGPFDAETPAAIIGQIVLGIHHPLQELAPSAPPAVIDLVNRMIAADPNARPPDAARVVAEIDGLFAVAAEPIMPRRSAEADPATNPDMLTRRRRLPVRSALLWLLLAIAAMAGGAAAVMYALGWQSCPSQMILARDQLAPSASLQSRSSPTVAASSVSASQMAPAAVQPGWRFMVQREARISGSFQITDAQSHPVHASSLSMRNVAEFIEQVVSVQGGQSAEVVREIVKAEQEMTDPVTGQTLRQPYAARGQRLRVVPGAFAPQIFDGSTGVPVIDPNILNALSAPIRVDIVPLGDLRLNQSWEYSGDELTRRLRLLNAQHGQLRLRVSGVGRDAETGLELAHMIGQLQTQIAFNNASASFSADVAIDWLTGIGLPKRIAFTGPITMRTVVQGAFNQQLTYALAAQGHTSQTCQLSSEALALLEGNAGAGFVQPAAPEASPTPDGWDPLAQEINRELARELAAPLFGEK